MLRGDAGDAFFFGRVFIVCSNLRFWWFETHLCGPHVQHGELGGVSNLWLPLVV